MLRVLFVEDDDSLRKTLTAILHSKGFDVTAAGSVPEALAAIGSQAFDVLLSDLNIGEPGDGFTVVSAMRRVHPNASTFILTGYPDFDSAIKAVRSQVDDYFVKPVNIEVLTQALQVQPDRERLHTSPPARKLCDLLHDGKDALVTEWLQAVENEPELAEIPLSPQERAGDTPDVLNCLIQRLRSPSLACKDQATLAAQEHGRRRYRQGYSTVQVVLEARILEQVLTNTIANNLLGLDFSTLIHDILIVGEFLNGALEASIRAYQSQIPNSLQASFSELYRSPYLGVFIVSEGKLIDANDAFLGMIGRTRQELREGGFDWITIPPEDFHSLDRTAMEQVVQFGTCAPYEREYLRPDGSSVRVLIGAIRLQEQPLQWAAYSIDLTEHTRMLMAEQRAEAFENRHKLINRLAHELNNPLAAMTFSLHLLQTHPEMPSAVQPVVSDSLTMLCRIADAVRNVLAESQKMGAPSLALEEQPADLDTVRVEG